MMRHLTRRAAVTAVPPSDMTALPQPMLPGVRSRVRRARRTRGQGSQASGISRRAGRPAAGRRPEFAAGTAAPEETCLTCRWVPTDDGALVMQWTTADGASTRRGTGGHQAASAVEVPDRHADALTPAGA